MVDYVGRWWRVVGGRWWRGRKEEGGGWWKVVTGGMWWKEKISGRKSMVEGNRGRWRTELDRRGWWWKKNKG